MPYRLAPKCPYCGYIMYERCEAVSEGYEYYYSCGACRAKSPPLYDPSSNDERIEAKQREDAYAAAMQRVEPEKRVLTLDEIAGTIYVTPCWLELLNEPNTYAIILNGDSQCFFAKGDIDLLYDTTENYGITWRCWLRKPTDAERAAAPWKEADHAAD